MIGDAGDAPSSGSPADSSAVLRELLAQGAERSGRLSYLALRDAEAVKQCVAAGVGASVELALGHGITQGTTGACARRGARARATGTFAWMVPE